MGYGSVDGDSLAWEERPGHEGQAPRHAADVTTAVDLQESRARMWRYPPHTRGRRHVDRGQEEVFVVLEGSLTIMLGEPPERVDVGRHGVVAVGKGPPLQLRNEGDDELVLFPYGAPPITGDVDMLEDV